MINCYIKLWSYLYSGLLILLFNAGLFAQTHEAVSPVYRFSIARESKPPVLTIQEGSLIFRDANGNQVIDANEECSISFVLDNTQGKGEGIGLHLEMYAEDKVPNGIFFEPATPLPMVQAGQSIPIEIPLKSDLNTEDGILNLILKINEPNGFGADPVSLQISTRKFIAPEVRLVDHVITSGMSTVLVKKRPFELQLLVQNIGYGSAEAVQIDIVIPEGVALIGGSAHQVLGILKPGEQKSLILELIVKETYEKSTLPIVVQLGESLGNYARDTSISLSLNQAMASQKMIVTPLDTRIPESFSIASLTSDIGRDIPECTTHHPHRYALIIGNEDYASRQVGLMNEMNVDYARNDAIVFGEYARKRLGIPAENIKLLTDATTGMMRQGIAWITNLMKLEKGNAEVFVYYSGHGLPDEQTKRAYLIPVDVNGVNLYQGIALSSLYDSLAAYPTKRTTVFLDACFSGGARNKELIALKGVKIVPKGDIPRGNTVVFASSSGSESSGIYAEKRHGFFTYYLLKELKESPASLSYGQWFSQVQSKVQLQSAKISKTQTPQMNVSMDLKDTWKTWEVE